MKGRTTLILFLCIIVLGAFIWIQESVRFKSYKKAVERARVFSLDTSTLVSLTLEGTNAVVDCILQNGEWMTGKAGEGLGRADEALMGRLVHDLSDIWKNTTITPEQIEEQKLDASAYGLETPQAIIRAVDGKGKHVWRIGNKSALGDYVYVKYGDDKDVALVSSRLLAMIPEEKDSLRDRALFDGVISGVRRMELRGTGGFLQMINDSKKGWQIQQPVVTPADQKKMSSFIDKIYQLRIEEFVADNVSDFSVYGLQGEGRQIALGGSDGSTRMLVLGEAVPDREDYIYARRADDTSVFMLKQAAQDLVMFHVDDFRDRRLLPLKPETISFISLHKGADQLELKKGKSGAWEITEPVRWKADNSVVTKLLNIWCNAFIIDFNDAPDTQDDAVWTLCFSDTEAGKTNCFEVLPPNPEIGAVRLRRKGSERSEYLVSLKEIPESTIDRLTYKDLQVMKFDAADIRRITLTKEGNEPQIIERKETSFVSGVPSAVLQVAPDAVSSLLEQVSSVTAARYVAYDPKDLMKYGLEQPSISLHVGLSGTNQLGQVLLLGKVTEDGIFAMVQGRDVVFLLNKEIVERLTSDILVSVNAGSLE